MANNRKKFFTRVDAHGNRITGTSVIRSVKPKVGRWVEEAAISCCFPYAELTYDPVDVTDTDFTFTLLCGAAPLIVANITTTVTTTIAQVVDALNAALSYLGEFTTDGTNIIFKLRLSVSEPLACAGILSFTVEPTP
jgi:hypothetical protein